MDAETKLSKYSRTITSKQDNSSVQAIDPPALLMADKKDERTNEGNN